MDNRDGTFKPIDQIKYAEQMQVPEPMVFKEGEILEIRGSRFRIEKIQRKKLILKLLPSLKQLT